MLIFKNQVIVKKLNTLNKPPNIKHIKLDATQEEKMIDNSNFKNSEKTVNVYRSKRLFKNI
jgi:hypothetical protein